MSGGSSVVLDESQPKPSNSHLTSGVEEQRAFYQDDEDNNNNYVIQTPKSFETETRVFDLDTEEEITTKSKTSSAIKDRPKRSESSIHRFIQQIESCSVQTVAVIHDNEHRRIADDMLAYFTESSIMAIYFDTSLQLPNHNHMDTINNASKSYSGVQKLIENSYVHLKVTAFALLVSTPGDVLKEAEEVFRKGERGNTAAMPHKTVWIVFQENNSPSRVILCSRSCVFDNIVLVLYYKKSKLHSALRYSRFSIKRIFTLMWRANRKREFQELDPPKIDNSKIECQLFPNKKFGFNGRVLDMLTKYYWKDNYITVIVPETQPSVDCNSTHPCTPTYSGLWYDIVEMLSRSLNFTMNISFTNVTWDEYRNVIGRGETDFGLTLWLENYFCPPLDTPYPASFQFVRGLYKLSNTSNDLFIDIIESNFEFRIGSMRLEVLLFILVLPFSVPLIFLICDSFEDYIVNPGHSLDSDGADIGVGSALTTRFKSKCRRFLSSVNRVIKQYPEMLWNFSGSLLSQSSLPSVSPKSKVACNILLCSFGLTVIGLYALVNARFTSEVIKPTIKRPFENYEQLVQNGDYKWGTITGTSIQIAIMNPRGKIEKLLSEGMVIFRLKDDDTYKEYTKEILDILDQRFVLLLDDTVINQLFYGKSTHFPYAAIKETIFYTHSNFVLPPGSEITQYISDKIIILHQSYLIQRLEKKYGASREVSKELLQTVPQNVKSGTVNTIQLVVIVTISVSLSVVTLIVENIINWCRLKIRKQM